MAGKGGQRKHGRTIRKESHKRYNANNTRKKNKMRRILQSNGAKFLKRWLKEHNGLTARARLRGG